MFSAAGLLNKMVSTFDMFGRKLVKLGRVHEVETIECCFYFFLRKMVSHC